MNWLNIIKNDKSKVDDFIALYKEYEAKTILRSLVIIGVAQKMPMLKALCSLKILTLLLIF